MGCAQRNEIKPVGASGASWQGVVVTCGLGAVEIKTVERFQRPNQKEKYIHSFEAMKFHTVNCLNQI